MKRKKRLLPPPDVDRDAGAIGAVIPRPTPTRTEAGRVPPDSDYHRDRIAECPACGYDLSDKDVTSCPRCGRDLSRRTS